MLAWYCKYWDEGMQKVFFVLRLVVEICGIEYLFIYLF